MATSSIDSIISLTFDVMRMFRQNAHCSGETNSKNFLQTFALAMIEAHSGLTMKETAQALHVTSPTATSFVSRLVKLRLVKRDHDKVNRKLVRLKLTKQGKEMLEQQKMQRAEFVRRTLSILSPKELDQLAVILTKLHDAQSSHS